MGPAFVARCWVVQRPARPGSSRRRSDGRAETKTPSGRTSPNRLMVAAATSRTPVAIQSAGSGACSCNCSRGDAAQTVRRMVGKVNMICTRGGGYRPDIQTSEVVALYQHGHGTTTIARHFCVTPSTILKRLRRAGIEIRPVGSNQSNKFSRSSILEVSQRPG